MLQNNKLKRAQDKSILCLEEAMAANLEASRNIIILGRTCTGKKSIANQILDKQHFLLGSSMDGVTREAGDKEISDFTDEMHYNMKIIDTLGPYSKVIDKNAILKLIKGYITEKVPNGINLILFTFRKDVYNTVEETDIIKDLITNLKDDVKAMCALVITGCEGLDENGKKEVEKVLKTSPETNEISAFMGKGIYPVGFPSLQNVKQAVIEELREGIKYDAKTLRKLVHDANLQLTYKEIFRASTSQD